MLASVPTVAPPHIEKARSFPTSVEYCSKPSSRVAGPYTQNVPLSSLHPDAVRCKLDPLYTVDLRPWQTDVVECIINQPPDDRTIYWFHEPYGNVGKSAFAKHAVLTYNYKYVSGKATDIKYAISAALESGDPRGIIWDVPRSAEGHISYGSMEDLKNGLFFSSKFESKQCVCPPMHIIVFANHEPNRSKMSADRWSVHRIERNYTLYPPLPAPERVPAPQDSSAQETSEAKDESTLPLTPPSTVYQCPDYRQAIREASGPHPFARSAC